MPIEMKIVVTLYLTIIVTVFFGIATVGNEKLQENLFNGVLFQLGLMILVGISAIWRS